jgi:hypothetical protein
MREASGSRSQRLRERGRHSVKEHNGGKLIRARWLSAKRRSLSNGAKCRTALPPVAEPERELYRRLRAERGDAYARYNSLIRELTSFQSALIRAILTTNTTG